MSRPLVLEHPKHEAYRVFDFAIILLKTDPNINQLLISAIGILSSIIASIVSAIERG